MRNFIPAMLQLLHSGNADLSWNPVQFLWQVAGKVASWWATQWTSGTGESHAEQQYQVYKKTSPSSPILHCFVVIVSFIQSLYLYLCGFFTPPVDGALFRAALVANCFLGAFPPVDLRAVCLVRAILSFWKRGQICHIPGIHTLMEFYFID